MKYFLTLLLSVMVSLTPIVGQTKNDITPKQQSKTEFKINVDTLKTRTIVDTLKVQIIPSKKETEQNNRPWIIALIVGILTFIAIITASLINKWVAIKGINSSKEIAIQQIENSQSLNLHQFNSTLKTKNRQDWVNDLKNAMSEFMANCVKINIEFQDPGEDNKEKIKDIHEKITLNRTKMRLLLNPKKELHNNLLTSMTEFVNILDMHILNYRGNINYYKNIDFQKTSDKVVENARELLYNEWQKIQKLTNDNDA